MPLDKYNKSPVERKRYSISYSEWLDTGEAVQSVAFTVRSNSVISPLVIDGIMVQPDAIGVQYYVSGGLDQTLYEVLAQMTTVGGQIKEDEILFAVRELQ
jgi:hypothetical protein